jgi:uncharacterized protein
MNVKEQIQNDIKTAMKSADQLKLTVLRGLSSSIKNKGIEKSVKAGTETALTDEEVLSVILSEAKKRKDSIKAFTDAGRPELAANEQKELDVLQAYLPKQLTAAEVEKEIERIMATSGTKEFGPLMKLAMAELRGKADGQTVTDIIKKKLG